MTFRLGVLIRREFGRPFSAPVRDGSRGSFEPTGRAHPRTREEDATQNMDGIVPKDWDISRKPRSARFEVSCCMAPRVGLEPTTLRLTAGCSTIELPRNGVRTRTLTAVQVSIYNIARIEERINRSKTGRAAPSSDRQRRRKAIRKGKTESATPEAMIVPEMRRRRENVSERTITPATAVNKGTRSCAIAACVGAMRLTT